MYDPAEPHLHYVNIFSTDMRLLQAYNDLEHLETPFVSYLHRFTPLAPAQPAFTFTHPNPHQPADNSRRCSLTFQPYLQTGALCHGLAGYFTAQLYGDVYLSIHPESHTPGMYSWFPMYIPVKEPVYMPPGSGMEVMMWRCIANHKVWYEWALALPGSLTHIHNPAGRSYFVGL